MSFAKICVEVDCSSTLPSSFDMQYGNGDMVEIRVQYSWKPLLWYDCKVFGHGVSNFSKKALATEQENVKTYLNLGKNVAPSHSE